MLLAAFVLGREVRRDTLDRALPRTGVEGVSRLGLADAAGQDGADPVRALVDLRPYACRDAGGDADWWVASDLGELATGRPLAAEHVLGVGGASVMLARCTVRTPVRRVLDLGTGCGIQALHAARHAGAVVATDLSGRALRFAELNLALNAVDGVTTRQGSLLEPVAGERFDLVVSNPPFVITPRRSGAERFTYRDGGLAGDEIVAGLVEGLPAVLAEGGVAQLLGNWEQREDEPWQDRVAGWLDRAQATLDRGGPAGGNGVLDAWVVQRELQDPAEYAETWIRDAGQRGAGPQRRRPADVVVVVRIAAVDQRVVGRQQPRQRLDLGVHQRRRHHQPHRARRSQRGDELVERGRPGGAFGHQRGDRLLRHVEDHALVARPDQPAHHVAAHPSQSDHPQLHPASSRHRCHSDPSPTYNEADTSPGGPIDASSRRCRSVVLARRPSQRRSRNPRRHSRLPRPRRRSPSRPGRR